MEDKLKTTRLDNATVTAQMNEPAVVKFMRGKALIDVDRREMTFVENAPRVNRSVEVGRTMHSRFVRRPDNLYTITFRVTGEEKYFSEGLVAEIREISKAIATDRAARRRLEAAMQKGEDDGTVQ